MTAPAALLEDRVLTPAPDERPGLTLLNMGIAEIADQHAGAELIGPRGERIAIPASAFEALAQMVEAMANGQTIVLLPQGRELSTQQAADLLHMSRPHLVALLEKGDIPFHMVGNRRRMKIEDVLEFRRQRAERRRGQLDELARFSEEFEPAGQ